MAGSRGEGDHYSDWLAGTQQVATPAEIVNQPAAVGMFFAEGAPMMW